MTIITNVELEMERSTCVVTGGTGGIGRATALALARMGARVLIVGRDQARGEAALSEIGRAAPAAEVMLLRADLASQRDVRRLAADLLERCPQIDVLVNNAATAPAQPQFTAEGIESTLATNYLGAYLLTELLRDRLLASAPARIVNVSSHTHRFVKSLSWADLEGRDGGRPVAGYDLTKLLLVLWTFQLAQELDADRVTANCLHPGWPVRTDLHKQATGGMAAFMKLTQLFAVSAGRAAATSVHLASSPALAGVSGRYFVKCREAFPGALAQDPAAGRRLVDWSRRMCNLPAGTSASG